MIDGGDRTAQKIAGGFALMVGAAMLIGHYFAGDHAPSQWELWIGGGSLLIGFWLVAPVGMFGLIEQARNALPFLEDANEGEVEEA